MLLGDFAFGIAIRDPLACGATCAAPIFYNTPQTADRECSLAGRVTALQNMIQARKTSRAYFGQSGMLRLFVRALIAQRCDRIVNVIRSCVGVTEWRLLRDSPRSHSLDPSFNPSFDEAGDGLLSVALVHLELRDQWPPYAITCLSTFAQILSAIHVSETLCLVPSRRALALKSHVPLPELSFSGCGNSIEFLHLLARVIMLAITEEKAGRRN